MIKQKRKEIILRMTALMWRQVADKALDLGVSRTSIVLKALESYLQENNEK